MSGSALVPPSSRRRARHGRGRPEVSREILELLGETTDGVLAIDARCRIISWNRSAERLLGYTAEDVRGRACYDIMKGRDVHGNIFCQAHCPVVLMARRRELPYPYDVVVQTKEGHERWVNVSTLVLPGRGGEPVVVHMFRDAVVLRRWPPGDLGREPRAAPGDHPDHAQDPTALLTRRERDVLRLMLQGEGTRGIARRLVLSPATVRSHTQSILTKLGVHSRLQAVALALRHRWGDRSL
jgi:PAS domain S-box-containing protein